MNKLISTSLLLTFLFLIGCKDTTTKEVATTLDVKHAIYISNTAHAKTLMSRSTESFIGLWGLGDAPGVSGEFTDDAVRVISNSLAPIVGGEAIKNSFVETFAEGSNFKNSHIIVGTTETRLLSDEILIGAGTFKILDANNETLESGKWGNVYRYKDGKVKFLLESAHRIFNETDTLSSEVISLEESIVSKEAHFDKIQASVADYIKYANENDAEGLSMLFTENAIQNVSSKEGIVVGRDKIKATEVFADGMVLDANILGYTYLGDSLAVGYGNWTQLDITTNTMVKGQWGNVFKIDGDTAYLVMESAGISK